MVDLHCHILPGLDDGAQDIEDSIEMARQAEADGIAAICATPHIRHDHDVHIAELPMRLTALAAAVAHAGCQVRVLPGGEVAATALPGLGDGELAAVTLGGGGRWVLLEPAAGPLDERLESAVVELRRRGFGAVIAHPERHLGPELVTALRRVVSEGALVQATAAWLTDPPTREGMLSLAREGLIHVLGSDAHSAAAGRPVALAAALEVLSGVDRLRDHMDWISQTAPQAVIGGLGITPPF